MPGEGTQFVPLDRRVRTHAVLLEVIDAIRLVGAVLALGGGFAAAYVFGPTRIDRLKFVLIIGLAVVPGVLYIVASVGLTRRRRWAWVMSLCVTILLMVAIVLSALLFVYFKPIDRWVLVPAALYALMPGLILLYMLAALQVVREAELLGTKGFMVIPEAQRVRLNGGDGNAVSTPSGPPLR